MIAKLTTSINAAACTVLVAVCLAISATSEQEDTEGKTMIGTTRETFTVSKALDYLNPDELRKQLGCERDLWLHALSKEVCDNSLDNCEEIGVLPEIAWTATRGTSESWALWAIFRLSWKRPLPKRLWSRNAS